MTLRPARTRWRIIERSNSAKAPVICNSSLAAGVVVWIDCWSIDADRFEIPDRAEQVDQRAAEPINGPRHDDVEPAPVGIIERRIEELALVPWCR